MTHKMAVTLFRFSMISMTFVGHLSAVVNFEQLRKDFTHVLTAAQDEHQRVDQRCDALDRAIAVVGELQNALVTGFYRSPCFQGFSFRAVTTDGVGSTKSSIGKRLGQLIIALNAYKEHIVSGATAAAPAHASELEDQVRALQATVTNSIAAQAELMRALNQLRRELAATVEREGLAHMEIARWREIYKLLRAHNDELTRELRNLIGEG